MSEVAQYWVRTSNCQRVSDDASGNWMVDARHYEALQARLAQCEGERDNLKQSFEALAEGTSNLMDEKLTIKKERDAALERVRELREEVERRANIKHADNLLMEQAESDKHDAKEHAAMLLQRAKYAEGRVIELLSNSDGKDAHIKALTIDNDNYRNRYHALETAFATLEAAVKAYVDAKVQFMAQREDVQAIPDWGKRDAEWKAILIPLLEAEQALLALRAGMR